MHKVTVSLEEDLLAANRRLARKNKEKLAKHEVKAYDVLGAIGSGKTTIILKLAEKLKKKDIRVGAIAGDVAGDDDYRRFTSYKILATNINTGKECHLDAHMVNHALDRLPLEQLDIIFIENVGNLVCPADFELGAERRIVIISVTEGEDGIRKHPTMFGLADVAVVNKLDLAKVMGVKIKKIRDDFYRIKPTGKLVFTTAKESFGLDELMSYLGL